MPHVVIIGCGIVGAAIAYELSQIPDLQITVLDRQPPAQAATGAALGVLMGAISRKTKGRAWALRAATLQRFDTLIGELETALGRSLMVNQQGIVMLCFDASELERWQTLIDLRRSQGWPLECWQLSDLEQRCPQINTSEAIAAIYSACDRQIDPTRLTLALVEAAEQRGVRFRFGVEVEPLQGTQVSPHRCCTLQTSQGALEVDWVVVAAGLGSTLLVQGSEQPITIQPVLGQAQRVRLPYPLGNPAFQPVISGHDIHVVPIVPTSEASALKLSYADYWVGATVEFPSIEADPVAEPALLQEMWQGAIALCPELAQAEILETWMGLRPRPLNRSAPIIQPLMGYQNVMLATGHYRNGVLLAPATAVWVRDWLKEAIATPLKTP